MFRLLIIVAALLAGCAARNTHIDDLEVQPLYDGEGLRYEVTRPGDAPHGAITVDLTLVELDLSLAETLLGIGEPSDIAPRSYRKAVGEIAAVHACNGHGRLLTRPTLSVKEGEETPYQFLREFVYLSRWEASDGGKSPLFDTCIEGVDGKLVLRKVEGGMAIQLDSASAHMAWPLVEFKTNPGPPDPVTIAELVYAQRVATETVGPGETAMFQLSRAPFGDGTRIRLLFVRLRGAN